MSSSKITKKRASAAKKPAKKPIKKPSKAPKTIPKTIDSVKSVHQKAGKTAVEASSIPAAPAKKRSHNFLIWGLNVAAVLLVALIGFLGFTQLSREPEEPAEVSDGLVEDDTPEEEPEETPEEEPEETPASTGNSGGGGGYHVASYLPRYITIPSIGLRNIPVVVVGRVNNAMDTPRSDYVVGWYNESKLPGQPGATMMTGHGGDLGTGILKTLPRVQAGQEIIIEMGDESTRYTYRIVETVWKHIGDAANSYMATASSPVSPGTPTLTIITCTGTWIPASRTYDHRLFVRAVLVNTTRG